MSYNEPDTRAKLIDPVLHKRGWTEAHISREENAGAIKMINGKPKRSAKRVDYTLRVRVSDTAQPVAVALVEAKAEHLPPEHGLQQVKDYATASKRFNVSFVFSSNGHQFVEYDRFTGRTTDPKPLNEFPTHADLRARYEQGMGFDLNAEQAKPLITPYAKGEAGRRYYQDASIRAVLEKLAKGEKRALLSLATGAGKTYIAVNLLKRIADAGQLRRALFVCDRRELCSQALGALRKEFGSNAAEATTNNPERNARVVVATYQILGIDTDDADPSFLRKHYSENYFSHIIIDECHRSAWGKWSEVLNRNSDAVQIGLTATPRGLPGIAYSEETDNDRRITVNNMRYFGDPVYEYSISQGIEDGYLAMMLLNARDIIIGNNTVNERESGISRSDLENAKVTDHITGEEQSSDRLESNYKASALEVKLITPDRTKTMCKDLFGELVKHGRPEQKTIVFCVNDRHADRVASALNNLYADWCTAQNKEPVTDLAFKCTAASSGNDYLPDIRGANTHHFIATTVDLLTTGVDIPPVVNIVFFRYVNSPISFYQMVGRGTRIHTPTSKLLFTVYDYTNARRLFGDQFPTVTPQQSTGSDTGTDDDLDKPPTDSLKVEGITVRVTPAGKFIPTINADGKEEYITLEQYRANLAQKVVEIAPNLEQFRAVWIMPDNRRALMSELPDNGNSPLVVRYLTDMEAYDLYDVMVEASYGVAPKTRHDRAEAFEYKNEDWLQAMETKPASVIRAIAKQFEKDGTNTLENPDIFDTQAVIRAGGVSALKGLEKSPNDSLQEAKAKIFSA